MAKIIMDIKIDLSEFEEIMKECVRLVEERSVPDHLRKEMEALADLPEEDRKEIVRMEEEDGAVVAVAGPRLLALVANLRACAPR